MRRIAAVLIVSFTSVIPGWAQRPGSPAKSEKELTKRWDVCMTSANTDAAIQACADVLATDAIQGTSFWRQQRWEKPISMESLADAYIRRGTLYDKKGRHDLALQDYESAARCNPSDAEAFLLLGNAWMGQGNPSRALENYDAAIKLDATSALAFIGRGGAFYAKGDKARAQQDIERVAALDPRLAETVETRVTDPDFRALVHAARTGQGAEPPDSRVAQTPEWKVYDYPSSGFSISFPSPPTEKKDDVRNTRRYSVEVPEGVLMVDATVVGESIDKEAGPDFLLQAARDGLLKSLKACSVKEKKVRLSTYAGVELEAQCEEEGFGAHLMYRLFIVGKMLYAEVVVSEAPGKYPHASRFLDSFTLIPLGRK